MDIDSDRIDMLRGGKSPIYEPGLEEMLRNNVQQERLAFSTSIEEAVDHAGSTSPDGSFEAGGSEWRQAGCAPFFHGCYENRPEPE